MQAKSAELEAKNSELPHVKVNWIRIPQNADTELSLKESVTRATAYLILGIRGGGKSSLGENLASHFTKIIDLYGSRDNESLAWCRGPFKDSVLFLKGASTDVTSEWDVKNMIDLRLDDLAKYDVFVSCSAFFGNIREEWDSLARLMERLWHRTAWREPICLLIREAANLIYSRLALGETQQQAKNYMIYVLREMRHCGFALSLDALRSLSVDVDLRTLADFTFFKAQGIEGLPDNLKFMYRYFEPYSMMSMPPDTFAVMHRKGAIGYGTSDLPAWHKREHENLLNLMKIDVAYREVRVGEKTGHLGDIQHIRIIELRKQKISMEKSAEMMGHSSRTILRHLNYHNLAVKELGECDKCSRANGPYAKEAMT
jgi:hypothetical protein